MRSWGKSKDRIDGKNDFVQEFQANPDELNNFKTIPGYARLKFAEWGHFYRKEAPPVGGFPVDKLPIPEDIVFEVHESMTDRGERDKRVVLIVDLGNPGKGPEPYDPADVAVWRCTYTPYIGADPTAIELGQQ